MQTSFSKGSRWALFAISAVLLGMAATPSLALLQATGQSGRKSTDPPLPPKGKLGQDLFIAIDHRDQKGVEALLARGADPNSRNGLEFTPLYIAGASHQFEVMQDLLQAGADKEAASPYGTPLTMAAMTGNVEGVKLLLDQGAKVDPVRTDGSTPLMMAANCGAVPVIKLLIDQQANVATQDDDGSTALALAARGGFVDAGKLLIDAGAKVNVADLDGTTPLMEAAMTGHTEFARLLLKAGAHPNATDAKGRTALFLCAAYGDHPELARLLVESNAKVGIKDVKGRTAADAAAGRGYLSTLRVVSAGPSHYSTPPEQTPREAVTQSLRLIQTSMSRFSEAAACVSCHHEGLGRITTGAAMAHGFHLDPTVQRTQNARLTGMVMALKPLHEAALAHPDAVKQLPLVEINEIGTTYGWLLNGMAAHNQPASPATAAMAMCLARQQSPAGCWTFSVPRTPMQSSFFTFTALAVQALQAYGPKQYASEVKERVAKARAWTMQAKAQNSEDRASRLLALRLTGADRKAIKLAAADILHDQRADGGWSQLPGMPSDAYATGQALYALNEAGKLPVKNSAYRRGVHFLLRTQDDDGSWFAAKRAFPANNYFDAGFPHAESQYASFNGTCWATLALLETLNRPSSN